MVSAEAKGDSRRKRLEPSRVSITHRLIWQVPFEGRAFAHVVVHRTRQAKRFCPLAQCVPACKPRGIETLHRPERQEDTAPQAAVAGAKDPVNNQV